MWERERERERERRRRGSIKRAAADALGVVIRVH